MGTHMIHLLITKIMTERMTFENPDDYIAGAMAPDSGLPVPGQNNTYDPPKSITHFIVNDTEEYGISDKLFFKNFPVMNDEAKLDEFRLGYFHHLLIDNLWCKYVNLPSQRKYSYLFKHNNRKFWDLIGLAWVSTDSVLLKENGIDFVRNILPDKDSFNSTLDFIATEKLNLHVNRISDEYHETWKVCTKAEEKLPKCWNKDFAKYFIKKAADILLLLSKPDISYRNIKKSYIFEKIDQELFRSKTGILL